MLDPSDNGLVLASNLSRHGVDVTLLATKGYGWVARTRCGTGHLLPEIRGNEGVWHTRLESLAAGGDAVLIPASDAACELVATERDRIPGCLRSFEGRETPHLQLMDKELLYQLAERVKVRYPASWRVSSGADLDRVAGEASYPCLLKPAMSHHWRDVFGRVRVLVLRGEEDLVRHARPALAHGLKLLITEYVPGPERNLEAIVTVRRADGSFALEYGRRKIRQQPPLFGAGTLQEAIDPSELRELAGRLLEAVAFVGVSSIEVKRHAQSGELVLIEVNVRVPQSWGVGEAARTDASWRLYATLAGIPLPPQPPQTTGVKSVVPTLEMHAIARALRHDVRSLRPYLATYRGVRDLSGLSLADPAPWFGLGQKYVAVAIRGVAKRRGRSARHAYPIVPGRVG